MRKLLLFTLLFVLFLKVNAQITFNKRMNFDAFATVLTSVIPTDSCYYLVGIVADSLPPYRASNVFAKANLEGNIFFNKKFTSTNRSYESWENTFHTLANNEFIVSGWSSRLDTISVYYMKYNSSGMVVDLVEFYHPDSTQATILNRDFKPTLDGGFVFFSSIRKEIGVDYFLRKVDSEGGIIWEQSYGNIKWDAPFSIIANEENGNLIMGGRKTNQSFVTENYQYQTYIIGVDSLGNELWTYLSPLSEGLRDGARDMILLDNGSLIVASGIGYEQERPSVNVVYFEKSVFKLNANQEVEWEVTFPEDSLTSRARTTNLLNTSDNSGFIVAGLDVVSDWEVTFQQMGWLAKLTYDGDSIWTRRYKHLDTDKSDHEFYDIKETADGGFILCGESRDRTAGAEIPQQAWLLKLDQHGCLIPSCHLIDDVTETPTVSYELKLFPNPTSDYLNIFMRHHRGKKAFTFRILNGIGQEMTVFEQDIQEETLMIDLARYGSGIYYLEVSQEGRILETEKFVVKK